MKLNNETTLTIKLDEKFPKTLWKTVFPIMTYGALIGIVLLVISKVL